MDGLTTNGVLVMHPKGGFTEESKPGVWREISVCGDVYTLRETRSAQQRGKLVSGKELGGSQKPGVLQLFVFSGTDPLRTQFVT